MSGKVAYNYYINKGTQAYKLEQYQEASRLYTFAVRLGPKSAPAHYKLGIALLEFGDYREAINYLKQALSLGYDEFYARLALGKAYYNLGLSLEAESEWRRAVGFQPNDPEANRLLAISLKAVNREKGSGDYTEALMYALAATKNGPEDYRNWSALAAIYSSAGQYEQGLLAAEEGIRLNPNSCGSYNNKADILTRLKKYEDALVFVNKAIEISESNLPKTKECLVAAYITRAEIFEAQGKSAEAIADYDRSLNASLDGEYYIFYREIAQDRLEKLRGQESGSP